MRLPAGLLDTDRLSHFWPGIYLLKLKQCSAFSEAQPLSSVWVLASSFGQCIMALSLLLSVVIGGVKALQIVVGFYSADRRMCLQLQCGISSFSVQSLHLSQLMYILI